jgi:hypothetical protein
MGIETSIVIAIEEKTDEANFPSVAFYGATIVLAQPTIALPIPNFANINPAIKEIAE